jgi:hypothetical protein
MNLQSSVKVVEKEGREVETHNGVEIPPKAIKHHFAIFGHQVVPHCGIAYPAIKKEIYCLTFKISLIFFFLFIIITLT